jgi:hypothetical protein
MEEVLYKERNNYKSAGNTRVLFIRFHSGHEDLYFCAARS